MNVILENELIERLAKGLPRSPDQLNGLRESDAEIVRLPGTETLLALTTDGIVEEIEAGLYSDPYLIGWMAVMVNASDLAAVGAQPFGFLLSETLPPDPDDNFLNELQRGVREACAACQLPVLGGDTNFSSRMQAGGTAIGLIEDSTPMTRLGCAPGDRLYATAALGLGGAFALAQLGGQEASASVDYRPEARLHEGRLLRGLATCCMDTSDGVIPTLDELMRLNQIGFRWDRPLKEALHPQAIAFARASGVPLWTMLAGPHGEFELLFTVARERTDELQRLAGELGWQPLELGAVVPDPGLRLRLDTACVRIDTAKVRNLFQEVAGDVEAYVRALLNLHMTS